MDTLSDDALHQFCRQARARSREHRRAMTLIDGEGLHSVAVGILRQELDSLIRVIYLLLEDDLDRRTDLLRAAAAGDRWELQSENGKRRFVTDREMVEIAGRLDGWVRIVYRFGCKFIHLSNLHDYGARDPFLTEPRPDRELIVHYLRHYHGGIASPESTFLEIVNYVPRILDKIATNLDIYLRRLEAGESGESL